MKSTSSSSRLGRHCAAGAAAVVLLATATAHAQGAPAVAPSERERALEARVSELERLVQQLVAQQQAARTAPAAAAPGTAGVAPAAVASAPASATGPTPIQPGTIVPNAATGTKFVYTGFVKADALWTDTQDGKIVEGAAGHDFYTPAATPVGGASEGTDLDAHVKQTRMILGTDTPLGGRDVLQTRVEFDLFGSALGNQRVSNTFGLQLRHAYVQWREWLVGQTWSNFEDVAALPEAVDFIGPTDGTVFVRQPQVRWTRGGLALSLENPETTLTPFGGGAQISTDDTTLPDLTARYTCKGDWGHFALAGLARQLKYRTTGAAAVDATQATGAVSLSGKLVLGRDDVRFVLLGGNLGRYVALNFANDGVVTGTGDIAAIDGYAGFVAYRHVWTPALRTNLYYAMQRYDNDRTLTGAAANKGSRSWTINTIWSPLPKLDVGAEFRHATRELESGAEGDLNRLQLTTKYSF